MAAKYSISLDWDTIAKDVVLPAESAKESKVLNGDASASAAAFEAVEQKLRDTKAHRRSALIQAQGVTFVACGSAMSQGQCWQDLYSGGYAYKDRCQSSASNMVAIFLAG